MKEEWLNHAIDLCEEPGDFYAQGKKFFRQRQILIKDMGPDLTIEECGFTKVKQTHLRGLYKHEESIEAAKFLWEKRRKLLRYGSVSFTCYNHFVKRTKHPFGPCIQAVVITLVPPESVSVDIFYRTTEFMKRFAADLVFIREDLMTNFEMGDLKPIGTTFHFANITLHPMYCCNLFHFVDDPVDLLTGIRRSDPKFHLLVMRWTYRYVFGHTDNFQLARRTAKNFMDRVHGQKMAELSDYLKEHKP
jgi:hypothetical protein